MRTRRRKLIARHQKAEAAPAEPVIIVVADPEESDSDAAITVTDAIREIFRGPPNYDMGSATAAEIQSEREALFKKKSTPEKPKIKKVKKTTKRHERGN